MADQGGSAPATPQRVVWPVRLTGRAGGSPLRLAVLVALLAALMPGINFLVVLPGTDTPVREVYVSVVLALLNTGVIGYCVGLLAWVLQRLPSDLEPLQPLLQIDPGAFVRDVVAPLSGRELACLVLLTGLVWYLTNIQFGWLGRVLRGEATGHTLHAWNLPFFLLLWLLLIYTSILLVRLANRLFELGRHALRIDLLATHRLTSFMEISQRTILLAVGGLAFTLVQGALLGELRPADWLPATVLVVITSAWLLLRPVWGVHIAIRTAREKEMLRIDTAIGYHESRTTEFLADPVMEALQRHRERIIDVSEWPITRSAWWRPVLYFVIPPLAWVAAALVESLVDASL